MKRVQQHGQGQIAAGETGRARSGRLGFAAVVAASALALLGASAAQASTVTVGSVLPGPVTSGKFEQVRTLFSTALPEKGANLVSPVNGLVVRWRVQGAKGGPFFLRVLRPNGKGAYSAHGISAAATPSGTGLQTFTTSLPVEAGDTIGIDPTSAEDEIGFAAVAGASYSGLFPTPLEGATQAPSEPKTGQELELSAEIQPAPAITKIAPAFGTFAGGTKVTITGTDFVGTSGVKFGTVPASSFTVESETQITATAPKSATAGRVDVTATTVAGTSPTTNADRFDYRACVVPKLKGKPLSGVSGKLRRAGCKLGKVTGKAGRHAVVLKQNRKAGKLLAPGSRVRVEVGPPSHR